MSTKKFDFKGKNPLFSGPSLEERGGSGIPYREVATISIERDPNQPRVHFDEEKLKELSESIKTYGILTPILVRAAKIPGKYILIAGERRLRAAKLAGLSTVPVLLENKKDETGERTLAMQLVENLQRSDLTPLERSHAIGALRDAHGLTVRAIAESLGISKSMVQRSLDILDLPDDLLNALREGEPESKILALAKIEDPKEREKLLKDIASIKRDDIVAKVKGAKAISVMSAEDQRLSSEIERALGLKVRLSRLGQGSQGKISVDFYSEEDLQLVFRKLVSEE